MKYDDPRLRTLRHRWWRAVDEVKDLKKRLRYAQEIARTSLYESDKRLTELLDWKLEQAVAHAKERQAALQEAKAR